MSTELVKKEDTGLALYDYGDNTFQGDTEAEIQEAMIPFLTILQGNHEEVKKQLIPGAMMGGILDRSSERLFDGEKGVHLVPVYRHHCVEEWPNDEDGGNFKAATHELTSKIWVDAQATQEFPNFTNPVSGNSLQETVNLWALLVDGDLVTPVVIVFKSKKLKYWIKWQKKALAMKLPGGNPPPYQAHQILLTTWTDVGKDASGNPQDFANVNLRPFKGTIADSLLAPDSPLLEQAIDMRKKIAEGFYKLDLRGDGSNSSDGEEEGDSQIPLDDEGEPIF